MTTGHQATIQVPDWVKDAVFYQIFPDRFARSERLQKPGNFEPWGARPTQDGYQGGDLLGVLERLDYLSDLGINAIYFNPIFQSACNHRYHTHDYEKVDPLLGGNELFKRLVTAAHERHIRIILDGVFNHASRGFFPFHDVLENGPDSPWLDWFIIEDWPLAPYDMAKPANYGCWVGLRALPKLNTDNPQVWQYLMQIAEFWIREYDIDGWRLDVPEEITTPGFWEEFRQRVKAIKPEAYIVGEIWRKAPEWLQGDRFDALMNYPFTEAVIAFTAGERVSPRLVEGRSYAPFPALDAPAFGQRMARLFEIYDWEINQVQLNLLDSHDTPRLLSLARGDKATVRLATLLQMTFPGAPCVYYGDEIGLRGTENYDGYHHDPDARWAFPWDDEDRWDTELLTYFKEVIALRHGHPALRHGRYTELDAQGDCYAFARHDGQETLVIVVNVGEEPAEARLPLDGQPLTPQTSLEPLFGAGTIGPVEDSRLPVSVPARSGLVLAGV